MTGLSVYTKEDEDYAVGVIQGIETDTGNLLVRGNLDLRTYSIPQSRIVSVRQSTDKIVLDIIQSDLPEYETAP